MRGFVNKKLPFTGREVSADEAKKLFAKQPFKLDLINDFTGKGEPGKEKEKLTVYETGDVFMDLCRGGHVENTSEIPPTVSNSTRLRAPTGAATKRTNSSSASTDWRSRARRR